MSSSLASGASRRSPAGSSADTGSRLWGRTASKRISARQALDWGLVDELAEDGQTVEKAQAMAEVVLAMPAATVRMVKQAVNATAGALHAATAFADADQSQLTASYMSAETAREAFRKR